MDDQLKALKVVDLKRILTTAAISAPARATKADLIARILNSQVAKDAFHSLYDSQQQQQQQPLDPAPAPPPPSSSPPLVQPQQEKPPLSTHHTPALSPEDVELEKRKARAARFGIPLVEPKINSASDDPDKLKARAQRFGVGQHNPKSSIPDPSVDLEEQERRRKRAERFGLKSSDPSA